MPHGAPRPRRARPVADAPIDALLLRVEDVTKGWLLTLLEQSPLDDAPSILAADLARDGPRMCDAVIRALADDEDLQHLKPDGTLEPLVSQAGEFAGAAGAEATSRAVDALRSVLWSALRSELPGPDADQISELAERLAYVIEVVRAAALRRADAVMVSDARLPRSAPGGQGPGGSRAGVPGAVDLPRVTGVSGPPGNPGDPPGAARAWPNVGDAARPDARSWPREVEPEPAASRLTDPLWIGAVEDEISRSEESRSPLSLLLVELDEAHRVAAVETPTEAQATLGRFAQSVRSVVRRQDILACETDTRAWIIARDTPRTGANVLVGRVATAVRRAEPWRGAPLAVSAGVAVLGEDGRDAATLIEAAEEAKFAAAATGVSVMPEAVGEGDGMADGGD